MNIWARIPGGGWCYFILVFVDHRQELFALHDLMRPFLCSFPDGIPTSWGPDRRR